MERKVPDVFDVFGIGGAYIPTTPRGGIALPGLVAAREDTQYCWSDRLNKQNIKWREGRSPCERPRTYDKFYQKTPGNFQALDHQTDSAVSMCSSDNEFLQEEKEKDKKKRRGKKMIDKSLKERRSSKTLTEQDIKHIERHLSMKRTIRKKIMRDLQSTFVLGPTDYILPLPCQKDQVDKMGYSSESNILDMLRDSQDSGHDSPHSRERKFRSCRVVRRRRKSCHIDSSSEELSNIFSDNRITERAVDVPNETGHKHNLDNFHSLIEPPPDYEDSKTVESGEKRSFWKRLIGRKAEKRKN